MESLAYLHLACAYETSTLSELNGRNQQPQKSRLSLKNSYASLELSVLNLSQRAPKLVFMLNPKFLIKVSTAGLALALMFSTPAFALLSRGSYGEDIVFLQERLKSLGYFPENVPSTGRFGSITEASVRRFQRDRGLVVDGKVGSRTWRALRSRYYRRNTRSGSEARKQSSRLSITRRYYRPVSVSSRRFYRCKG